MHLLARPELFRMLGEEGSESLGLDPLLTKDQVGAVSIDLRLGYDFLVSVLTHAPQLNHSLQRIQRKGGFIPIFKRHDGGLESALSFTLIKSCLVLPLNTSACLMMFLLKSLFGAVMDGWGLEYLR